MTVRAKTKRRLILLLAAVFAIGGAVSAFWIFRTRQIRKQDEALREQGLAALRAGDFVAAQEKLLKYVKRHNKNPEVFYALANATRRLPSPDGRQYLLQTKEYLVRYLALRPETKEVRRELLELCTQLGYNTEALDAAETLLAQDPNDYPVLRAKAIALTNLHNIGKALEISERCNTLQPMDVEMQSLTLQLYRELSRFTEIIARAEKFLEAHPDEARAEFLMSRAYSLIEDRFSTELRDRAWERAKKVDPDLQLIRRMDPQAQRENYSAIAAAVLFARKAAEHKAPDVKFARLLMIQLERLGLIVESTMVLEKIDPSQEEPWVRQLLIYRLWEMNRHADLVSRLEKLDLKPVSPSDIELMALKAIALERTHKHPEADVVIKALEARREDKFALAWAAAVRQFFMSEGADPAATARAIIAGLELFPGSTYLRYFLADAYVSIGERDLAIEAFRQVIAGRRTWVAPRLRLSTLLLDANQRKAALEEATMAARLWPTGAVLSNLAMVQAAGLDREALFRDANLAALVADIQRANPGDEQTLPLHIMLLAKSGSVDAAKKALRDSLAAAKPPSQACLIKLASASREAQLGMEDECYALAEKAHGSTAELAYARALELHLLGKTEEGAARIDESWKNYGKPEALDWRLAWAQYLDQTRDPRAKDLWIAIGDDAGLKNNLAVQRAALAARSVQGDFEFLARVVERVRILTGEQGNTWRLARARLYINDRNTDPGFTQTIALLRQVVRDAPSDLDALVLLASALEKSGNVPGAVEQLVMAARFYPDALALRVDLARLHQSQLDYQRARELIEDIPAARLPSQHRSLLARLFEQQGESARAQTILETIPEGSRDASAKLLLAEVYHARGMAEKAESLYTELLKSPDPQTLLSAAHFYASLSRFTDAEKLFSRLEGVSKQPGLKEFALAEYHVRYSTAAQAMEQYRAAVKTSPAYAPVWSSMIAFCMRQGKIDDALATVAEAAKAIPDHRPFQVFQSNAELLKRLGANPLTTPLAISILQSPADSDVALECLRLMDESNRNKEPAANLVVKLRPLVERAPHLVPLQSLLVQIYWNMGRADEAIAMAASAMKAAPASPEMAQLAVKVMADGGEWTKALAAAQRWRELTFGQPLRADQIIAEICIRLNDLDQASRQLARYMEPARKNPDGYVRVILLQAQILARQKAADKAADLLWPMAEKSAEWRLVWLDLALSMAGEADISKKWLERISPLIGETAIDERIALANVWYQLGLRTKEPKYRETAMDLLNKLGALSGNNPAVLIARAVIDAEVGRAKEAEVGYRKALQINPNQPLAQNNLAMILAEQNGDIEEAMRLATEAVKSHPELATFHDTLGYVQSRTKNFKNAIGSLKTAIRLEPGNPLWRVNLGTIYFEAGERDLAGQTLTEVEALNPDKSQMREDVRMKIEQLRTKLGGKPAGAGK